MGCTPHMFDLQLRSHVQRRVPCTLKSLSIAIGTSTFEHITDSTGRPSPSCIPVRSRMLPFCHKQMKCQTQNKNDQIPQSRPFDRTTRTNRTLPSVRRCLRTESTLILGVVCGMKIFASAKMNGGMESFSWTGFLEFSCSITWCQLLLEAGGAWD